MRVSAGFSLAELLLALLILGQIAAFSIPKVLTAQQDSQKKAVYSETLSMLAEITSRGVQMGELTSDNNREYYFSRINAIKFCNNNASTEGCWNDTIQGQDPSNDYDEPGFILASGMTVAGIDNFASSNDNSIIMDYNGIKGPNIIGQDQIQLCLCYGPSNCTWIAGSNRPEKPGVIGPDSGGSATLYDLVFD